MTERLQIYVGMKVRLRKLHPCGSDVWTVTRTGADIGIVCSGCARRVMLERDVFERRVRSVVDAEQTGSETDAPGRFPGENTT
jgi:hypothetical protein